MITRTEYMNGKCDFRTYYSQFVTTHEFSILKSRFTIEELSDAYMRDEHFNTIPLRTWDLLSFSISNASKQLLRDAGDSCAPAFLVCVMKTAAKLWVDGFMA